VSKVKTKIWLAAIAAVAMLASSSAGAAEIDMTKGPLKRTRYGVEQLVIVKNDRADTISLGIECGLFHGNDLVGMGSQHSSNIEPGQTAYVAASANLSDADAAAVDRTDCRIAYTCCTAR
jgi:hypothetical protein